MALFITGSAVAQFSVNYRLQGDRAFDNKEYFAAAQYYSAAINGFGTDTALYLAPYSSVITVTKAKNIVDLSYLVYRLAESYRLYNDFTNAGEWYFRAMALNNDYPLARFWYAICLRADQRYSEALTQFQQFKSTYSLDDQYSNRTNMEIENCKFAIEELEFPRPASIEKLTGGINAGGSNYATAKVSGSQLYFTSSRIVPDRKVKRKENPFVNNIYAISGSGTSFGEAELVTISNLQGFEQGTPALTPDGNTMFITRWKQDKNTEFFSIFRSNKNADGSWSEPLEIGFEVNMDGFNSIQPSVTSDGKYLLYSSTRPGGLGGYDLWYCTIDGGNLGQAVNFGSAINSADDEQSPVYINQTKSLIFSSNGRIGMGGFDFFEAKGTFGEWQSPRNMGYPLNSGKDDLYWMPSNSANSTAYISSDRESVCCLELFSTEKLNLAVKGEVIDCDTRRPIIGATVVLFDSLANRKIATTTVDANGRYFFDVYNKKQYQVQISKQGYFTKNVNFDFSRVSRSDTLNNGTTCLRGFQVGVAIILKDIYYDFDKAILRPQSKLVLDTIISIMKDNPGIRIEMASHTDNIGSDEYNNTLSQERAQSCVDYMISRGIPRERLVARGYGKSRPIAPNTINGKDNPDGRQLNRRTEFTVLDSQ